MLNKRILLSIVFIFTALTLIVGAAYALFTDVEISTENILTAGEVDLGIDNHSYYNGKLNPETTWRVDYDLSDNPPRQFFNFSDLKPGDWGEDTISLHVRNNDAWVCADITLTSNNDNGLNEPEELAGDTDGGNDQGELTQYINFYWWADDGDNVYETDESLLPEGPLANLNINETVTISLADSLVNIWGDSGPIPGDEVRFLAKAWCFGNAAIEPYTQDGGNKGSGPDERPIVCNGSEIDNTTQTDSATMDIAFRALQSRHNPAFTCNNERITPTLTLTPTPPQIISCEAEDIQFATTASSNDQGLRKDSSLVLASRSNPAFAFGAPQTTGLPSDPAVPVNSFFSLGFPLDGKTASIVYGFADPFFANPSGADLMIYEVTGGVYPDEKIKVEAASTSIGPWTLLSASVSRDAAIELGVLSSAQYVRLTDVSNINDFTGTGDATPDGYDLDALKTFCKQQEL